MQCGHQGCARHATQHFSTPRSTSHALTVDTADWAVWCFTCNEKVSVKSNKKLHEAVQLVRKKQGTLRPTATSAKEDSVATKSSKNPAAKDKQSQDRDRKSLPKVKGLINLGNSCYLNSVLQCISQCHYLTHYLDIGSRSGRKVTIIADDETMELVLPEGGPITASLCDFLKQMHTTGTTATVSPSNLLRKIALKVPQFVGCDQQDAHELLRSLMEQARLEDLRRHQRQIMRGLSLPLKPDPKEVSDEMKARVKALGKKVSHTTIDTIFSGQLVSLVVCQACMARTHRLEPFLDMSLPVAEDKPTRPRKLCGSGADDEDGAEYMLSPANRSSGTGSGRASKHSQKKETKTTGRARKHGQSAAGPAVSPDGEGSGAAPEPDRPQVSGDSGQEEEKRSDAASSAEGESDADEEDNGDTDLVIDSLLFELEPAEETEPPATVSPEPTDGDPAGPADPADPVNPANPADPVKLVEPVEPVDPADPATRGTDGTGSCAARLDGSPGSAAVPCEGLRALTIDTSPARGRHSPPSPAAAACEQLRALSVSGRPESPDWLAPGRLSPGRSSPGRSSPGRTSPGRSSPGRTSPGRSSPGRSSPGRSSPDGAAPPCVPLFGGAAQRCVTTNGDLPGDQHRRGSGDADAGRTGSATEAAGSDGHGKQQGSDGHGKKQNGLTSAADGPKDSDRTEAPQNGASDTLDGHPRTEGDGCQERDDSQERGGSQERDGCQEVNGGRAEAPQNGGPSVGDVSSPVSAPAETDADALAGDPAAAADPTLAEDRPRSRHCSGDAAESAADPPCPLSKSEWLSRALTTLAPRYQPAAGECSLLTCLNQFTAPELLAGNNKFGCDNCTELRNKRLPPAERGEKRGTVYSNASKQLLVYSPPPVLTIHLKRFEVCSFSLRKVNRHVQFGELLDLAPFCSSISQDLPQMRSDQHSVLYSLFGLVEHSGRLNSGHYTAYVRVRRRDERLTVNPARLTPLVTDAFQLACERARHQAERTAERTAAETGTADSRLRPAAAAAEAEAEPAPAPGPAPERAPEPESAPVPEAGRWFHVSDTHVTEMTLDKVLKAQAYMLFYERIV